MGLAKGKGGGSSSGSINSRDIIHLDAHVDTHDSHIVACNDPRGFARQDRGLARRLALGSDLGVSFHGVKLWSLQAFDRREMDVHKRGPM